MSTSPKERWRGCAVCRRSLVNVALLRHFCLLCVSLSCTFLLTRFLTRSMFFDMSFAERKERGTGMQRTRAQRAAAKDFSRSEESALLDPSGVALSGG